MSSESDVVALAPPSRSGGLGTGVGLWDEATIVVLCLNDLFCCMSSITWSILSVFLLACQHKNGERSRSMRVHPV